MWTYNGKRIREGRAWRNADGIQHPTSWGRWSDAEKVAAGLVWVDPPASFDNRFYWDANTPKALDDVNAVDTDGTGCAGGTCPAHNQHAAAGCYLAAVSAIRILDRVYHHIWCTADWWGGIPGTDDHRGSIPGGWVGAFWCCLWWECWWRKRKWGRLGASGSTPNTAGAVER